jgi:four helix bundle protein
MRDHTQLRAFKIADEVVIDVYQATRSFPKEEVYGLTSQMRRSAVSVPSNIVEGCSRDSQSDFLRFLYIAFGSLKELNYQVSLSTRLSYLPLDIAEKLEQKISEAEKILNGLIRSIRDA